MNEVEENEAGISPKERELKSKKREVVIGFILLAIVIVIFVLSSIIIKDVYKDYPKPFAFTYFDTLFLALLIPIFHIKEIIKKKYFRKKQEEIHAENDARQPVDVNREGEVERDRIRERDRNRETRESIHAHTNHEAEEEENLNHFNNYYTITSAEFSDGFQQIKDNKKENYEKVFKKYAVLLMALWYLGNSFYNSGLSATSITSSNTLSNTSIVFIFLIKILVLRSKCAPIKIVATVVAGVGIFFIAKFESTIKQETQEDSLVGDLFVLLGAFFYSIYSIVLKLFSKKYHKNFDMMEMFGYIGLFNFLLVPLPLLLLHFTTLEVFVVPTPKIMLYIFINALISGIIADLLQNYAITMLSPIMVSFGLTFVIPLSYIYDLTNGKITFNYQYLLGSVFIFSSFGLMVFEKYRKMKAKEQNINEKKSKANDKIGNTHYIIKEEECADPEKK